MAEATPGARVDRPDVHGLAALLELLELGPDHASDPEGSLGATLLHIHPHLPATARAASAKRDAEWQAFKATADDLALGQALIERIHNADSWGDIETLIMVDFALRFGLIIGYEAGSFGHDEIRHGSVVAAAKAAALAADELHAHWVTPSDQPPRESE